MVTINFIGDISLFKVYEELNIDPFSEIFLQKSDYNIGNFEFIFLITEKNNSLMSPINIR